LKHCSWGRRTGQGRTLRGGTGGQTIIRFSLEDSQGKTPPPFSAPKHVKEAMFFPRFKEMYGKNLQTRGPIWYLAPREKNRPVEMGMFLEKM